MSVIWTPRTRTSQPQGVEELARRFKSRALPAILLPSAGGLRGWTTVRTNANFTGPRIQALRSGLALRVYSDSGGADDDLFISQQVIQTARVADLTTVIRFVPLLNQASHRILPTNTSPDGNPSGHGFACSSDGSILAFGYMAGNGFEYRATAPAGTIVSGAEYTAVISTSVSRKVMSLSLNGANSMAWNLLGLSSYITGGGVAASYGVGIGSGGGYTNYYGFNGFMLLYAALPDVFIEQAEAMSLAANPWQLFAPIQQPIYFAASAGGLPTLSAAQMTGITATGGYPRVSYAY